jgi:hypothetical protein
MAGLFYFNSSYLYKTSTLGKDASESQAPSTVFILGTPIIWWHILQVVLLAGGALLLCSGLIAPGLLVLAITTSTFTKNKGIELDLKTRQYRFFASVLGLKIGDWESLPAVDHITMKYFTELVTSGKAGRMRTVQDKRYIVMFSVLDSYQGVILHETKKYRAAISLTSFLAHALNVEAKIYDHV